MFFFRTITFVFTLCFPRVVFSPIVGLSVFVGVECFCIFSICFFLLCRKKCEQRDKANYVVDVSFLLFSCFHFMCFLILLTHIFEFRSFIYFSETHITSFFMVLFVVAFIRLLVYAVTRRRSFSQLFFCLAQAIFAQGLSFA